MLQFQAPRDVAPLKTCLAGEALYADPALLSQVLCALDAARYPEAYKTNLGVMTGGEVSITTKQCLEVCELLEVEAAAMPTDAAQARKIELEDELKR